MQHHQLLSESEETQESDVSDSDSEATFADTEEESSPKAKDDHDFDLAEYQAQYIIHSIKSLYSKCYLCPRNTYGCPPGHLWHTLDKHSTSDELVNDIQDDAVFLNNSQNGQAPVTNQLWAGYSKGMVRLTTQCVLTALLRPDFIKHVVRPPSMEEKEDARK
ncbi:hypothetical protein F5878DRAFT_667267 [Lentinula raphanica]|uniref:Uncharacterized protein n=1 Tax=Lentinula raphanica TaxID=153919 RepID=A0AA38NWE0_9AGAR|nr:hypothetical protein F5878DRAFT_667267 [Lentinula raphanica]